MSWTPITIASAASSAPTVVLPPITNAIAMPGSTPWASASPRKLSPRSTTHVPITLVQHTLSSAAHSASRRNGLSVNGRDPPVDGIDQPVHVAIIHSASAQQRAAIAAALARIMPV